MRATPEQAQATVMGYVSGWTDSLGQTGKLIHPSRFNTESLTEGDDPRKTEAQRHEVIADK
jgi:hypothetical protein